MRRKIQVVSRWAWVDGTSRASIILAARLYRGSGVLALCPARWYRSVSL